MILRSILGTVPCVLPFLLAADNGGPSGGGGSPTAPEPQGNTLEEKLSSAKSIIGDYFRQLSGAFSERDTAVADLTAERDAHTATKAELSTLNSQLSTARADLSTMTGDRDTQKTEREKSDGRVTLIESFAKHHGLDLAGVEKFKAVKEVPEGGPAGDEGKALYTEWQDLKKTNSKKATAFFRKHKAELKEYAASLGD